MNVCVCVCESENLLTCLLGLCRCACVRVTCLPLYHCALLSAAAKRPDGMCVCVQVLGDRRENLFNAAEFDSCGTEVFVTAQWKWHIQSWYDASHSELVSNVLTYSCVAKVSTSVFGYYSTELL